jgi:hypothetical protein
MAHMILLYGLEKRVPLSLQKPWGGIPGIESGVTPWVGRA